MIAPEAIRMMNESILSLTLDDAAIIDKQIARVLRWSRLYGPRLRPNETVEDRLGGILQRTFLDYIPATYTKETT